MTVTVILMVSVTTIQNCELIDDDNINAVCNSDCTTIQGRFTTEEGGNPIKDVDLEFDWHLQPLPGIGLGGKRRKIMTGRTDKNGAYKFVFYAKDEELAEGSFSIEFKVPDDTYLIQKNYAYLEFFGIHKRDTSVIGNYPIPKKGAVIHLRIKNPNEITGDDLLICSVSYKYDINKSAHFGVGELSSNYRSELSLNTAANQYTYINTSKKVNGQYINLDADSVMISINETMTYDIEF